MISVILPFRTTPCCHSERWYTVILSAAKNLEAKGGPLLVHCHSSAKNLVLQILHSACGSVQEDKGETPFRKTKGTCLKRFDNSLRIEYSKEELRLTSRKNKEKRDDFHF